MSARRVLMPADIRFPLERANGVQILKTARALAGQGMATTLLVRQSDPRDTEEILALYGLGPHPGLTVRRVEVGHRPRAFLIPRLRFLGRALQAARETIDGGGVVYTRDLQLADLLLGLGPIPVVYEAHAVEALMYGERSDLYGTHERPDPDKTARLARRERRVWERAAAVVTTTAGIRDTFASMYGARAGVAVIPNGCEVRDGDGFPGLRAAIPPRVLYAGQLYPWKGVDVLVEAMAAVPAARLVILGGLEGERDLARIRALVAARGMGDRIEMAGTVPQAQVAAEMARASVVVVPFLRSAMTERHTSPLKAFEAMAAGRPLVASDLPSSREFLRHGENALLTPPGDPVTLAAAIHRLLGDRALAERLARTAHAEAPRYSWTARAEKVRAVLEAVL